MSNKEYYLSNANFSELVKKLLAEARVIAPVEFNGRNILEEIREDSISNINLSGYRTVESFKSYIFKLIEQVSSYFGTDISPKPPKYVFLGARGCDTSSIEVLDNVYLEGPLKDTFYEANRKNITIISADCADCGKTCFCTMVNGKPYAIKMFDLNFSPMPNGFLVEVGSDRGREIVDKNPGLFTDAEAGMGKEKVVNRQKVLDRLAEINAGFKLKLELCEIHKRNIENKYWKVLTKDCVECSACNFICPTCTCFVLLDHKTTEGGKRDKVWDACLKSGYAKVAGGANARGKLYERLQNRYQCKFDYSYDRQGRYTCVGCGRCIDGCAGNIDMRKIFVELERQVPLTAKLK